MNPNENVNIAQDEYQPEVWGPQFTEWVDLARYPLDDLAGEKCNSLIESCQRELLQRGVCVLNDFLLPKAIDLFIQESNALLPLSYHSRVIGNAYLQPKDPTFTSDHPRNLQEETSLGVIAYDQIPQWHGIRQLYELDTVMEFIGRILGKKRIYRYADSMGALNISVMHAGDYLRWHFDQTDFVVSLALQDSEAGGDFEFSPFIRSTNKENFDSVKEVLMGTSSEVQTLPMSAGTLVLFEGRNSIHRVTRIEGEKPRLVALLGYDTQPGIVSTEHLRYMRYGRTV